MAFALFTLLDEPLVKDFTNFLIFELPTLQCLDDLRYFFKWEITFFSFNPLWNLDSLTFTDLDAWPSRKSLLLLDLIEILYFPIGTWVLNVAYPHESVFAVYVLWSIVNSTIVQEAGRPFESVHKTLNVCELSLNELPLFQISLGTVLWKTVSAHKVCQCKF